MFQRFALWLNAWLQNDLPYQREKARKKNEKYHKEQEKKKRRYTY